MKKIILGMTCLLMLWLTGCSMEQKITIQADFSSDLTMGCYTDAKEEDSILKSLWEMGMPQDTTYEELMKKFGFSFAKKENIDGVEYNCYTTAGKQTPQETRAMFVELDAYKAVYDIGGTTDSASEYMDDYWQEGSSSDVSDMGFCDLIITYPFKVGKANGVILEDGYTVKYDVKQLQMQNVSRIYATSVAALAQMDSISVKGVKNKKAYKKEVDISVESNAGIVSLKLNGKPHSGNELKISKDGKYTLVAESASGKIKTVNFCVDKKKPTTNIKNKKVYKKAVKITFKDSISGVKKATLNGKRIKSGKKLKKNGNYTLKITDKAGNVKTVKFSIKK